MRKVLGTSWRILMLVFLPAAALVCGACDGDPCASLMAFQEQDGDTTRLLFPYLVPNLLQSFLNDQVGDIDLSAGTSTIDLTNGMDCAAIPSLYRPICTAMDAQMPYPLEEPITACVDLNEGDDCDCRDGDCQANRIVRSIFVPFLGASGSLVHFDAEATFEGITLDEAQVSWTNVEDEETGEPTAALLIRYRLLDGAVARLQMDSWALTPDLAMLLMLNIVLADRVNGDHEIGVSDAWVNLWVTFGPNGREIQPGLQVGVEIGSIEIEGLAKEWEDIVLTEFLSREDLQEKIADRLDESLVTLPDSLVPIFQDCVAQVVDEGHLYISRIEAMDSDLASGETDLAFTLEPVVENIALEVRRRAIAAGYAVFETHPVYTGDFGYDVFMPTVTLWSRSRACGFFACRWTVHPADSFVYCPEDETCNVAVRIPEEDRQYRVSITWDPEIAGVNDSDLSDNTVHEYLSWDPDYAFQGSPPQGLYANLTEDGWGNGTLSVSGTFLNLGLAEEASGVELSAYVDDETSPASAAWVDTAGSGTFYGEVLFSISIPVALPHTGMSHDIRLVIDPDDDVEETLETNNETSFAYVSQTDLEAILFERYKVLEPFDPEGLLLRDLPVDIWVGLLEAGFMTMPDVVLDGFLRGDLLTAPLLEATDPGSKIDPKTGIDGTARVGGYLLFEGKDATLAVPVETVRVDSIFLR